MMGTTALFYLNEFFLGTTVSCFILQQSVYCRTFANSPYDFSYVSGPLICELSRREPFTQ